MLATHKLCERSIGELAVPYTMTFATPFMMFQRGTAEAALEFYVNTVPHSRIISMERFGPEGPGPAGTVRRAVVEIAGQRLMAHDTLIAHGFDFTPSWSFFIDCEDEVEIERLFTALSEGGGILMPLANYGWSPKFGWVNDRFGVSWQLNLT